MTPWTTRTTSTRTRCTTRMSGPLLAILMSVGVIMAGHAQAQGLERFQPGEGRAERLAINRAVRQCIGLIHEKTAPARVSLKGPCRKPSREWSGVERLEPGYRLRFTVSPADSSAGTLLSAIQGEAVRVFCTADAEGQVTQFVDVNEGVRESFSSAALCWPAGD